MKSSKQRRKGNEKKKDMNFSIIRELHFFPKDEGLQSIRVSALVLRVIDCFKVALPFEEMYMILVCPFQRLSHGFPGEAFLSYHFTYFSQLPRALTRSALLSIHVHTAWGGRLTIIS